jgi:hypothetical protein
MRAPSRVLTRPTSTEQCIGHSSLASAVFIATAAAAPATSGSMLTALIELGAGAARAKPVPDELAPGPRDFG